MFSESYVEDNIIILPVLRDGVTRLGDLWDCHESKYVGENLFKEYLDGEYINASPIQDDEFKLIHCKSTSDKFKTINVGGEISVELLAGLITIKGSANYNSDKKEMKQREQLICHSRKEIFSVDALPKAKNLLDSLVVEKILKKSLKATHFVRRLTLGAEVKADILVTQDEKSSNSDIKEDFFGKIVYGPINASIKASLGILDSENNTNFKKEINVHSMPAMKANPKSVDEMFQLIENINTTVNEQKHFPINGDKVIGVPIRFVLVPIKEFLDFDVEKLYLTLSDKVMKDFNEMLVRVHDIQVSGHISKKLLEMNSNLAIILFNYESKLSREIRSYEKKMCEIGVKYFEESVKTLKQYKIQKATVEDLLGLIDRFQQECNSVNVFEQIMKFKEEGLKMAQSKNYYSYINRGKLEIRISDQPRRSNDWNIYKMEQAPSIDKITLDHLFGNRKYGAYLTEFTSKDKSFTQLRGCNLTPYKVKRSRGQISTFNICSIYPRYNQSNPAKSVIGHLIDTKIKSHRAMISHEQESNFPGHKDIESDFKWPENYDGLKIIYFDNTSGIVSDEMVNRYYASQEENDWISINGYNKPLHFFNHEFAGNRAVIAVRGDIKFNNINNKYPEKAKLINEGVFIGLNSENSDEKPVYILKPKINDDLSLYAINSEYHTGMRKNKTVVIDINANSVIELMSWTNGINYIEERKEYPIHQINEEIDDTNSIIIHKKFANVYGNSIPFINYEKFARLNPLLKKPVLDSKNLQQSVVKILPYIIQKIKMWGCNAMTADNIISLISIEQEFNENHNKMNNALKIHRFESKKIRTSPLLSKNIEKVKISFSRFDILTGLINEIDSICSQDIFNIMAKFPLALPLIIRDLHEKDSYRNLMPLLTRTTIKWESIPGKIIENNLFMDKFKMIVSLRIGKTSDGKCGKSTILNQILSKKNIFSCCGEPGANRGAPVTGDGSVEFVYLTQETASPILWESVLQKHYESGVNEVILLANVHGNALHFENHLKLFKTIASSFIIFIMPEDNENLEENWDKLVEILEVTEKYNTSYIAIDPPRDKVKFYALDRIMKTSRILDDSNIEILRNVLKNCLINPGRKLDVKNLKSFGKTKLSELIETKESQNLIKFIEQNSCKYVKKVMSLQKGNKTHEQCVKEWSESTQLKKVIELMGEVLSLERDYRLKAIIHIEKELNRISAEESALARQHFYKCLHQLQKTIGASGNDQIIVSQWKEQMKIALDDIDQMILGLEHFYREIGKLYEINLANSPANNPYSELAKSYAELFAGSQAIELLDGDSGKISKNWLSAIFADVYRRFPGMRIFVISILGLQSSGKSTLLNALFACKFSVSVGRCTRGLLMRLLFLDEKLKEKLNFDAILLIDTEGLGAPEKQKEPEAERKDRIMATFAMGISHLTIINVLGEYMRDLTEILQISIVAMARLEKADISPDILIVQHLNERNIDKMTNASKQFSDALEKAINIADEKFVGIRDSKCLNTLRQNIFKGNLFRQFRPFKNGTSVFSPPSNEYHQDVVELYKSIIDIAENSENKADLKNWQLLIYSYWDNIREENLMRFKDVKDLQEYCQRGEIMAQVKESIESVFREHSEIMKNFITDHAKKLKNHEITRELVLKNLKDKLKFIPFNCTSVPSCDQCKEYMKKQSALYDFVAKKPSENDTRVTVHKFIIKVRDWHFNQLAQMINAIMTQQNKSAETLETIQNRLRDILNTKTKLSSFEKETEIENIWLDIEKETAKRVTKIFISDQMLNKFPAVNIENHEFIHDLEGDHIRSLKDIPAIHRSTLLKDIKYIIPESDFLELNQAYELECKTEEVIAKFTNKTDKVIIDFEQIIKNFEKSYNLKLKTEFKLKFHSFSNQIYKRMIIKKQQEWNEIHNPMILLQKAKPHYIQIINERLKYGFSYDSEGFIAGNSLLYAIKQKALESVNKRSIDDILSIDWLSNSENIRLKYFLELVEQVKHDNFKQALNHFDDPKRQIEEWFKRKINSSSKERESHSFRETFTSELNQVKKEIEKCSSIKETEDFIDKILSSCNYIGIARNFDSKKVNKSEFDIFRSRILVVLNDDQKISDIASQIEFACPSNDKLVMDRMGCNFTCPLCSALCWGHSGHKDDEGEYSQHHTCHQPLGLSAVCYLETKKLVCNSCDNQKDDDSFLKGVERISWSSKKSLEKYKIWKFENHVIKEYNDLMKWFFYKLNEDIAKNHKLYPADIETIEAEGLNKIDIGTVMAVINGRIYG